MLNYVKIENVLFLDIETVSAKPDFEELDEDFQSLWEAKSRFSREREGTSLDESYNRAGIYAEFGKIVCISVGFFHNSEGARQFRTKSFFNHDEKLLLEAFIKMMDEYYQRSEFLLCAHNGKEFDFPYIARRILVNGLRIPHILDTAGKKPWEVSHLDTMQLWRFGDYKHYTSIKLLAKLFDIPSPKDDIDGSQVGEVYWKEKDLNRIESYCRKDVVTVAQVLLKYKGEDLLDDKEIEHVD